MKVLVTAGPTRERIDPVRFISNYSTGTFGYAIAAEALRRGHGVTLVSGPTRIAAPAGVRLVKVESAIAMRREVKKRAGRCDCVIMAAAVCDWRPRRPSRGKIKKRGGRMSLELEENPDILAELGRKKRGILVGFALETGNLEKNALAKLKRKNLDLIVANRLAKNGGLFGGAPTDIAIMDRSGRKAVYRRRTKRELAKIILDKVEKVNI